MSLKPTVYFILITHPFGQYFIENTWSVLDVKFAVEEVDSDTQVAPNTTFSKN